MPGRDVLPRPLNRLMGAAPRTEAEALVRESRIKVSLQHLVEGLSG